MERAEQLRISGQALIGCGQYALDCVQPKCAELERICTEFAAHFNYRRSRLRDAQSIWRAILHVRDASHLFYEIFIVIIIILIITILHGKEIQESIDVTPSKYKHPSQNCIWSRYDQ